MPAVFRHVVGQALQMFLTRTSLS